MNLIHQAIAKYEQMILDAERHIWKTPETGYKEFKTNAYLAEKFRALGYDITMAEGITGFYTVVDTGREGPEVLVLGELDSVICPSHPECDPETGAVHSCGHHAQCAALLGIAAALREPGVLDGLSGRIRLCAVPAEELLEIEFRSGLKAEGKIRYFGGKSEFLYRGYFDGVDLAFMIHTAGEFLVRAGFNGCLAKQVIYKGRATHAGGTPEKGINALYAANCGLNAVNALRETFCDEDYIRVHPIVTAGGSMVNAIPDRVVMESYVRGKTFCAMLAANEKINRALTGAALSMGANIEIIDSPGYSPENNDMGMMQLAVDAAALALPEKKVRFAPYEYSKGSSDMGDLSCVMPVVQPNVPGRVGNAHGADYFITDPKSATVESARWQLAMIKLLLEDGAKRAKEIVANFQPEFATKEEFLAYIDAINCSGDRIVYNEDGTVTVIADSNQSIEHRANQNRVGFEV